MIEKTKFMSKEMVNALVRNLKQRQNVINGLDPDETIITSPPRMTQGSLSGDELCDFLGIPRGHYVDGVYQLNVTADQFKAAAAKVCVDAEFKAAAAKFCADAETVDDRDKTSMHPSRVKAYEFGPYELPPIKIPSSQPMTIPMPPEYGRYASPIHKSMGAEKTTIDAARRVAKVTGMPVMTASQRRSLKNQFIQKSMETPFDELPPEWLIDNVHPRIDRLGCDFDGDTVNIAGKEFVTVAGDLKPLQLDNDDYERSKGRLDTYRNQALARRLRNMALNNPYADALVIDSLPQIVTDGYYNKHIRSYNGNFSTGRARPVPPADMMTAYDLAQSADRINANSTYGLKDWCPADMYPNTITVLETDKAGETVNRITRYKGVYPMTVTNPIDVLPATTGVVNRLSEDQLNRATEETLSADDRHRMTLKLAKVNRSSCHPYQEANHKTFGGVPVEVKKSRRPVN